MKNRYLILFIFLLTLLTTGALAAGEPMELVFELSRPSSIEIPLHGTVNATIDWGDGSTETVTKKGLVEHNYAEAGTHTVQITGTVTHFGSTDMHSGLLRLTEVKSYGDLGITSLRYAFTGSEELTSVPDTLPPGVTDLHWMLYYARNVEVDASGWDVSNVVDMAYAFGCTEKFNSDLSGWDVSKVKYMRNMFESTRAFDSDLSGWDISQVGIGDYESGLTEMFDGATGLSRENYTKTLIGWGAQNLRVHGLLITVECEFLPEAAEARDHLINEYGWVINDRGPVRPPMELIINTALDGNDNTIMINLSYDNNCVLIDWGDGNIERTVFRGHFSHTYAESGTYTVKLGGHFGTIGGLSNELVEIVNFGNTDLLSHRALFSNAINLKSVPAVLPEVVTNISKAFSGATSLNCDISGWDISNVESMDSMLTGATAFSCENYSKALIAWSNLPSVPSNVALDIPSSYLSSAAAAREKLINSNGWVITDGGIDVSNPMELVFNTALGEQNNTVTLPLSGSVSARIDWGDGNVEMANSSGSLNHTYAETGIYTVKISGQLSGYGSDATANADKLTEISSFGIVGLTSLSGACKGAVNLTKIPSELPSTVTDLSKMFMGATSFNGDISSWNVVNVTTMSGMLTGASAFTSENYGKALNTWDNYYPVRVQENVVLDADCQYLKSAAASHISLVSRSSWTINDGGLVVGDPMVLVYNTALGEQNNIVTLPLAGPREVTVDWGDGTTELITDEGSMVSHTYEEMGLYTIKISGFLHFFGYYRLQEGQSPTNDKLVEVVSFGDIGLEYLYNAFRDAVNLTKVPAELPSIVERMSNMFKGATSFNDDLSGWDVSNVFDMRGLFSDAILFNGDISTWDVTGVGYMDSMFTGASAFSSENYSKALIAWSELPDLRYYQRTLDADCKYSVNAAGARNRLITEKAWIINDGGMMAGSPMVLVYNTALGENNKTVSLPLDGIVDATIDWGDGNSEKVTSVGLISHTYAEAGVDTVKINGSISVFGENSNHNADKLIEVIDFGELGISSLNIAFQNAVNLTSVPSTLPSSVTELISMFEGATSFNSDVSSWNVSNVTDMSGMFEGATSFNSDLSSWDVSKVTDMSYMFNGATSFNSVISSWDVSNVNWMDEMFIGATSFSSENYSNALIAWGTVPPQRSSTRDAGTRLPTGVTLEAECGYFPSAAAARQSLITNYNWVINDAGELQPQTITFAELPAKTYGDDSFTLGASASSEMLVSYALSNDSVISVTEGTAAIIGAGTVEISAYQLGNYTEWMPSDTTTITLTVQAVNVAPVIEPAIPAETVVEGAVFTVITLDDYVSDPDNIDTELTWTTSEAVNLTISISEDRKATVTAIDPNWNGSETVTFTVKDPGGLSANSEVTFTVTGDNDAPTLSEVSPQTINEDTELEVLLSMTDASDADGDEMTIILTGGDNYSVNGALVTPSADFNGELIVPVTVTDNVLNSETVNLIITVAPVNDQPTLNGALEDALAKVGEEFTLAVPEDLFDDIDEDQLTLSAQLKDGTALPVWLTFENGEFSGTPSELDINEHVIVVTATDPSDAFVTDEFLLSVDKATAIIPWNHKANTSVSDLIFAPNPASINDKVSFVIPSSIQGEWTIKIYDNIGNLIDSQTFHSDDGRSYYWDLRNKAGLKVAPGSYIAFISCRFNDGSIKTFKKGIGIRR